MCHGKVSRWVRARLDVVTALTLRQRLGENFRCILLGQISGAVMLALAFTWYELLHPAQIELLQPQLELRGQNLTVVRVGFSYRGVETICRFVIHHNANYDWSARC